MKRALLTLLALGGAVAFAAGTGVAGPGGSAQDSAYGGGRHAIDACTDGTVPFCPPAREFSLDAHASPSGGGATGTFEYANAVSGAVIVSADVTCLAADGPRAVVGGRVNEGDNAGIGFLLYLEDNGRPGSPVRDRVSPVFLLEPAEEPAGFPRRCPAFEENVGGVGYFSQTYGDVAVRDR